ncbi:MAG: HesA/MoeB/ThiF family protein [bacterium]|nr:HesA/MoeB/ThiF family protein [bacterium]
MPPSPLDERDHATYEWQLWVDGFGAEGQAKLKGATVLVTRVGGLGGVVAYELAAAGVGRLVLAHAGNLAPSDLNRQLLMTHDWLGKPRVECAERRLRELNPRLEVDAHAVNADASNVAELVDGVDLVVDCAPMFEERLALNAEIVRRRLPMVECAMYELAAQVTTIVPGRTPCLACRVPTPPPDWKRQFPVFGAVSGSVGCIAAMEAIKVLAGLGEPLLGRVLAYDLRDVRFSTFEIERDPACPVCAGPTRCA